ncbi:putative transposase [Rhodococcus wratislaviensis IFP 2016]|nr:putative transposase [Rhodococcus wratislaviensis IFP 2016]
MKSTGPYPSLSVDTTGTGVVSQGGAVTLLRTAEKTGLTAALSTALAPWRKPLATHDPGKILLDLAVSTAVGGDCLADIAVLREEPAVFGTVASDPTVSRLITTLAADVPKALSAINTARATARARAWSHAGAAAPDHEIDAENPLIIDLDATLVTAHSEKEEAALTYKRGFGFHPLCGFVDHGPDGTGEPLAFMLRPGNAGSNTAADHIELARECLRQLPFTAKGGRVGRKVLIRTDGAGGTHAFVDYLERQKLSYSVGFGLTDQMVTRLDDIPAPAWTPAYNADGHPRDGAWVVEATDVLDLSGWPAGMRVIVRKERPHPGAQLRFTDVDGLRLTAFVTNAARGQPAALELRHRRRARCEDRIRTAKDTGLRNLPLHGFAQNQIWLAVVALAVELTAWMQMIALPDHAARRWEPKRLRLRLFSIAGRLARHARRTHLRLSAHAPWKGLIEAALTRLAAIPAPT